MLCEELTRVEGCEFLAVAAPCTEHIALACSTGWLIIHLPQAKRLVKCSGSRIACMCFSPNYDWLLVVTVTAQAHLIQLPYDIPLPLPVGPPLTLTSRPDSCTVADCVWWTSFALPVKHYAIVATLSGRIIILDLRTHSRTGCRVGKLSCIKLEMCSDEVSRTTVVFIHTREKQCFTLVLEKHGKLIPLAPQAMLNLESSDVTTIASIQKGGQGILSLSIKSSTIAFYDPFVPGKTISKQHLGVEFIEQPQLLYSSEDITYIIYKDSVGSFCHVSNRSMDPIVFQEAILGISRGTELLLWSSTAVFAIRSSFSRRSDIIKDLAQGILDASQVTDTTLVEAGARESLKLNKFTHALSLMSVADTSYVNRIKMMLCCSSDIEAASLVVEDLLTNVKFSGVEGRNLLSKLATQVYSAFPSAKIENYLLENKHNASYVVSMLVATRNPVNVDLAVRISSRHGTASIRDCVDCLCTHHLLHLIIPPSPLLSLFTPVFSQLHMWATGKTLFERLDSSSRLFCIVTGVDFSSEFFRVFKNEILDALRHSGDPDLLDNVLSKLQDIDLEFTCRVRLSYLNQSPISVSQVKELYANLNISILVDTCKLCSHDIWRLGSEVLELQGRVTESRLLLVEAAELSGDLGDVLSSSTFSNDLEYHSVCEIMKRVFRLIRTPEQKVIFEALISEDMSYLGPILLKSVPPPDIDGLSFTHGFVCKLLQVFADSQPYDAHEIEAQWEWLKQSWGGAHLPVVDPTNESISLTHEQVETLLDSTDANELSYVFTCDHAFGQTYFHQVLVPNLLEKLRHLGAPETAKALESEYFGDICNVPCPNCVFTDLMAVDSLRASNC